MTTKKTKWEEKFSGYSKPRNTSKLWEAEFSDGSTIYVLGDSFDAAAAVARSHASYPSTTARLISTGKTVFTK